MHNRDLPEPPAYERRILDRLGQLYLERAPQPRLSRAPLTIWEFYRLCRYIKAEGYGAGSTAGAAPPTPDSASRDLPQNRSD